MLLATILPLLISVIIYLVRVKASPYIIFMTQKGYKVDMTIIEGITDDDTNGSQFGTIAGEIDNKCFVREDDVNTDKIIVVDTSKPHCTGLLERGLLENCGAAAVIILDNTPTFRWRVSSPLHSYLLHSAIKDHFIFDWLLSSLKIKQHPLPFLLIRRDDWFKFNYLFKQDGNNIFISWNNVAVSDFGKKFTCSNSSIVKIENIDEDYCEQGQFLKSTGLIVEKYCVTSSCYKLGRYCPRSSNIPEQSLSVPGHCFVRNGTNIILQAGENILSPAKLLLENSDQYSDYCCHRTNTSEFSYLEVLGEGCFERWREVQTFHKLCHFTAWIEGMCEREMMRVYRVCLVPGLACVVREYFITMCSNNRRLPLCSNSVNAC